MSNNVINKIKVEGVSYDVQDTRITDENVQNWNGKQPAGDYALKSEIPDTSNFITKAVDDLENYYKKSETYTQEQINTLIGSNEVDLSQYVTKDEMPVGNDLAIFYWNGVSGANSFPFFQKVIDTQKKGKNIIIFEKTGATGSTISKPIFYSISKDVNIEGSHYIWANIYDMGYSNSSNGYSIQSKEKRIQITVANDIITNVGVSSSPSTFAPYLPTAIELKDRYQPTSIYQPANIKYVNDYVDEQVGDISTVLSTLVTVDETTPTTMMIEAPKKSCKVTGTETEIEVESEVDEYDGYIATVDTGAD